MDTVEPRSLTSDELNRLWQHGMHEENSLNTKLNFFVVLESVLLGVVTILFSQNPAGTSRDFVIRIFLVLGLTLTIVWGYSAARQKYVFDVIRRRLREVLPEYVETRKIREQVRWPVSDIALLTYFVPVAFVVIWIALQFAV